MENKELARYFDATILSNTATPEQIKKLALDAVKYNFASVCVNPVNLPLVTLLLRGSDVKACTVTGFPLGETTTSMKVAEAKEAVKLGASEIDMVASVSRLKSGDNNYYLKEIENVKSAIGDKTLKVIIETCYLNEKEIQLAAELCVKGGADFVKTSTGLGTRGVSTMDIELIRDSIMITKDYNKIHREIGIKASGGIKTKEFALELIKKGAWRLGVSGYADILK